MLLSKIETKKASTLSEKDSNPPEPAPDLDQDDSKKNQQIKPEDVQILEKSPLDQLFSALDSQTGS